MILLDSNYIVSFLVEDEKDHIRAFKLSKNIKTKEAVITHAILIETINLLTKKLNRNTKAITEIFNFIKSEFTIIYETEELTEKAMQTLIKYNAKIGLADAINIEVMKKLNIHEIISFDEHFDNKEGIVKIH
ncbi:MAG: PIN domain-containing protein [Methanobrevibacter sp.]|nr:PIN domain-containing protein [Methanobrevibacter sp.]